MNKIGLTQSGMVIVEMTQAEFAALQLLHGCTTDAMLQASGGVSGQRNAEVQRDYPSHTDAVRGVSGDQMTLKQAVDYCAPRLVKLAPKKKAGALNGLRAMFNFQGGVSDDRLEEIYQALLNRNVFKEHDGKLEYE